VHIAPPDFDRMFGALADHTRRDIVFRDGFANADGTPNTDLPMFTGPLFRLV
jgi:hypothetical protein